ncbi:MAG: glycosyltransferase family 4 protein, partial [Planctomycetota bacterium]
MLEYVLNCSIAFSVAVFSALLLTPLARRGARSLNLMDYPDTERKLHARATPLGGGVAVFAALLLGLGAALMWGGPVAARMLQSGWQVGALLVSGALILAVGLVDDYRPVPGRQKLAGQCLVIAVLIGSGLYIERVEVFHATIALGILGVPFTMLWLLGAVNSINLLDGADGFAATIGVVICCAVAGMAIFTDHPADAAVAAAMAGALVGFLFFNFPPASIFLGDGGSMLIGLL